MSTKRPVGVVSIDGRPIGKGLPVYLVAAAGSRHGGDIQLGYKLIETAGAAGADAILLQRGGLSEREVKSLFGHARQVGLTALGEASDEGDIDLLASLDVQHHFGADRARVDSGDCSFELVACADLHGALLSGLWVK